MTREQIEKAATESCVIDNSIYNTTMKQKKRINGKMHCGSCIHFINEGFYGDGWCDKYDVSRRCGNECLAKENKGNTRKISSK